MGRWRRSAALAGVGEGGGELVGGNQPAVVGPQLVDRDHLRVVVGPLMAVQRRQVVGEGGTGRDRVAAVGGVQPVVVLDAAGAVVGGVGKDGVGTRRAMPACSITVMASPICRLERW